jgi:hypothetical protein
MRRLNAHPHNDQLERSIRWFRKAVDSDDVIDRFVAQWIAFNVLYGLYGTASQGETAAINTLINSHPSIAKISQILTSFDATIRTLASRGFTSRDGRRNYSDELRNLLGSSDLRSTLKATGICLWRIRNEVFHGGAGSTGNLNFTRECSSLLERIYRDCLCDYLGLP